MEPELEDLASEIKHCFIGLMRTMRGSPNFARDTQTLKNKATPALDDVLPEAARLCAKLKVTPELYVRAQNQYFVPPPNVKEGDACFFPSALITSKAEANVERFQRESQLPLKLDDTLYIQKQYLLRTLKNTSKSVEEVLLDDNIDFTPWFRILVTTEPNPRIIAKYQRLARSQLSLDLRTFLQQQVYKDGRPFDLSRITP